MKDTENNIQIPNVHIYTGDFEKKHVANYCFCIL